MKKNIELKCLILAALFAALDIVCTRVLGLYVLLPSPATPLVRGSLQILWFALAGWTIGPGWAMGCAMTSDLAGVMINAAGGAGAVMSPGRTLSAGLTGLLLGLLLYKRKIVWWRPLIAVILQTALIGLPLNALWLKIESGADWMPMVLSQLPWRALLILPYWLLIFALQKALEKPLKEL